MFQNSDFRIFSKERGAIKSIECMEQGDNNALLIVKKGTFNYFFIAFKRESKQILIQ